MSPGRLLERLLAYSLSSILTSSATDERYRDGNLPEIQAAQREEQQ